MTQVFIRLNNVVLIAIDFENISNIQRDLSQNLNGEVGLAILDASDVDYIVD